MSSRALLFTGIVLLAEAAHACSCGTIASAKVAREYSSVVFEGTVIEKRIVLGTVDLGGSWTVPLEEYTLAVRRSWKGSPASEIRLRQGYSNCDEVFSGGQTYLIFAGVNHDDATTFTAGKCGPTKPITSAGPDLYELGPATARFDLVRQPASGLPWSYFPRLYLWSGIATYRNAIGNPHVPRAWRALGLGGVFAATGLLIAALAVALLLRGRRTLASGLVALTVFMLIAALLVSGAAALRSGFYEHYKHWTAESPI